MAGGSFTSYNKVRAGAYINFEAVPKSLLTVGDRGIVAIALPLKWGPEDKLIEVLSSDMLDGNSKKKVGFTAFNSESKLLSACLSYCYKALVYRTNSGGAKATTTIGALTITAKYTGTFGNKINIVVNKLKDESGLHEIITYVDGAVADTQKVSTITELDSNDYVDFSGDGSFTEQTAGKPLEGGTDGASTDSTAYPNFINLLKMARWQTLACVSSDSTAKTKVAEFIEQMREDEGRYVQAVINDTSSDYEGIINSVSGVVVDGVTFEPSEFVSIVAGMTAGANINESNTSKVVKGATEITNEMTDAEIKEALKVGKFIISTSPSGKIKVEKDINSLHTFTQKKNYNFSKNRVIRTLDEIGTSVSITWDNSYSGKQDNTDNGRNLFKADLIAYGKELERISAIQEFLGGDDIDISQGPDLDSVIVNWNVKPVDSMEKLYMTVKVRG